MARRPVSPPPAATEPPRSAPAGRRRVVALRDGFRRAGRAWPAAGVTVSPAELTPEQWAAVLAEPMLAVSEIEG